MIKFYTDENVAMAVVKALRRRGVDVLTTQEANMLGAPDEEHLERAKAEGRVIFTQDDDFLRLHAQGISHAGIVYAHQRKPVGTVIQGLLLIYQVLNAETMKNHVEFL